MANPTYNEVDIAINDNIVTNHNNEITATVLNPILMALLDFSNSSIGILNDLNTTDKTDVVSAINETLSRIDNVETGIVVLQGEEDPNDEPPIDPYGIGDMYSQVTSLGDPIYLYIYTGISWYKLTIPNLSEVIAQGGNINVSQLNNDGDGVNPYITALTVDGMSLTANSAASEINLLNANGDIISTLNVAFLNNEGTTFIYNDSTKMLELWNDQGVKVSEVPVGDFVSNLVHSASFNATTPSVLEFKDTEGNIVFSVTYAISNIAGLQTALNGKANTDGSNASGTWDINILGTSSLAERVITSGSGNTKFNWSDGGAAPVFLWGASDIDNSYVYSPSVLPISTAQAAVNAVKANADGSNASGTWSINVNGNSATTDYLKPTIVSDFDVPTGFKILQSTESPLNGVGVYGQGIQFAAANNNTYTNQLVFDVTGNLLTRSRAGGAYNSWSLIPFDQNVLHKGGAETITGVKTFDVSPIVPDGVTQYAAINYGQLEGKANADGSNTYGTWSIDITGTSGNSEALGGYPLNDVDTGINIDNFIVNYNGELRPCSITKVKQALKIESIDLQVTILMPATNVNSYSSSNFTILGAAVGDFVDIASTVAPSGVVIYTGVVTAADTVTVHRYNGTGSTIASGNVTFKVRVRKS